MSSLAASLFVSETIHPRTVKLPDGSEHTLHFKELPATVFRAFHLAEQSKDEDTQTGSMARLWTCVADATVRYRTYAARFYVANA